MRWLSPRTGGGFWVIRRKSFGAESAGENLPPVQHVYGWNRNWNRRWGAALPGGTGGGGIDPSEIP